VASGVGCVGSSSFKLKPTAIAVLKIEECALLDEPAAGAYYCDSDRMATKRMMNTMSALIAILTYGIAVGVAGLMLALRERARRKHRRSSGESMPSIAHGLHGRLRIDTGEELEVYLQKAGQ
jgi:hypothetical protein